MASTVGTAQYRGKLHQALSIISRKHGVNSHQITSKKLTARRPKVCQGVIAAKGVWWVFFFMKVFWEKKTHLLLLLKPIVLTLTMSACPVYLLYFLFKTNFMCSYSRLISCCVCVCGGGGIKICFCFWFINLTFLVVRMVFAMSYLKRFLFINILKQTNRKQSKTKRI